jgi:DNA-directed RNA polymerase specialized sigma24 family protein
MALRSRYARVTNLYGRVGVVVRHALKGLDLGPGAARLDGLARLDEQRRTLAAVRELPEPYRSALFHRDFEGLREAEIARRLGVPLGTVEARLRRARALLAERLGSRAAG